MIILLIGLLFITQVNMVYHIFHYRHKDDPLVAKGDVIVPMILSIIIALILGYITQ